MTYRPQVSLADIAWRHRYASRNRRLRRPDATQISRRAVRATNRI